MMRSCSEAERYSEKSVEDAVYLSESSNTASTMHSFSGSRICEAFRRSPRAYLRASISMDLPAPVSPVKIFNLSQKSIESRSINPKF